MIGPFSSTFELFVFIVVFIIWCFSLILEPFIIKKNKEKKIKSREDKQTGLIIHTVVLFSIAISFVLGFNGFFLLPYFSFYIGIIFTLSGIFIREFAIISLRNYFSFQITIFENQKVVDSGIYHYILHPSYTGCMLWTICISIFLGSILAISIVIILCIIAYSYRVKFEEKILNKEFGEKYLDYKRKTKRYIPFIY